MPITLYVDHIQGNYSQVGRVIDLNKIRRIWELIDADMDMITDILTKTDNIQHICRAGRLLVATHILLDDPNYKYQMSITDVRNDRQLAITFVTMVQPPLRELANDLVNQITHLSDEEFNKFEMVVGDGQ